MTRHNSGSYGTTDDRNTTTTITPTIPESAGITLSEPEEASGELVLAGHDTVTEVWQELLKNPKVLGYLIRAGKKAMIGLEHDEAEELLDSLGITDTPLAGHDTRHMILDLGRRPKLADKSKWILCEIAKELGTGLSTVEDLISMARLFQFAHYENPHISTEVKTLTITVELEYEKFEALRRSQRTNVCRLLHVLSKAFDIRLAASQNTQAFLKEYHQEDLPCVSEWTITQRGSIEADEALARLDPNGTSTAVLNALDEEPDGTLCYVELYETIEKSDSRIRQCLGELKEYGLVESFGSPNNKKVSLLEIGAEVLDNLQQQSERRSLPEANLNPTPNPERQRREYSCSASRETEWSTKEINREEGRRPQAADHTAPQHEIDQEANPEYPTGRMGLLMRDAVAACGNKEGMITVVDDSIEQIDSSLQLFSVDDMHEEVVVSTHATTPLDYAVGSAMALAHPKVINEALDEATLATLLNDTPVEILSWARHIAYVPFEEIEAQTLRDALLSCRNNLMNLTLALKREDYGNGEFDSRSDLLSEILRQAHGLTGCIVHLLDAADFNVVRDLRVPAGLNSSKVVALAESIAHSITVQSRYKQFSAYRQLFEERESYRTNSFSVEVDAADPYGSFIGSVVLRGGSATRVKPALVDELEALEPHEDAPEFAIPVTFRQVTRDTLATATERVLERRNITVTEQSISVLHTLVESPFRVTRALNTLSKSREVREIEPSELRFALQQLSADNVMPRAPRSVGQIMMALLEATEPISQSELADRADVTGQTIRNRTEELTETGLVEWKKTPTGAKEWLVRISSTSVSMLDEKETDEVLVGSRPKQTAIGDAGEVTQLDTDTHDGSSGDADDEEVDADFSGITIMGSPPTGPEDLGISPEDQSRESEES